MLFLSINIKNTLNQNFFLVNTLSLQKKFIYLPLEKVEKKMGLLDLFKKKKFDETDLKSITYKRDGITSVSLLYLALSELGANVDYYIPLRDEGYGLNKDAIQSLKNENADLVISVDCGIN